MSATSVPQTWGPYRPGEGMPWNLRRVVHLHGRAGFAVTWADFQRDLADGPKVAIDRLLDGKARTPLPDFERIAVALAESAVNAGSSERLKAWWVYRMLFSSDPLRERLTLLWHNHFATSNDKVRNLNAMWWQNELLREFARGSFGELLKRAVQEPALLTFLDAPANRKGHPNENLARELLELFTLGIGHYSEKDVKEAARTLTGWTVDDSGRFRHDAAKHDDGEKTVLGKTGRWNGDDLIRILLDHPATAMRLATRICELLMGENVVDAKSLAALASGLRDHKLDIRWGVETVLRSQKFFADDNIGNRVLSPAEFVIGAVRALELIDPPPSTLVLAEWIARLGQGLFYPPNVGGWPGGRAWLTAHAIIGRANFAAALVEGTPLGRPTPLDVLALADRYGFGKEPGKFFSSLLLGMPHSSKGPSSPQQMVARILASPAAQLG